MSKSKVLTTKTKLKVKQICSLIAGVILCIYIFIPLFVSLSIRLSLLIASGNLTLFQFTRPILEAIAYCVSGFLTGLIISSFSTNREISTTVLGSLIVSTFVVIQIRFIPFRSDVAVAYKAYCWLLEIVVCAICLLGFAIIGAWLIARRRHLQVQKASK